MTEAELRELLSKCRTPAMPARARERLLALIEAGEDSEEGSDAPAPIRFPVGRASGWLAVAAMVLVAGGISLVALRHGAPGGPTEAEAREAARKLKHVFASTSDAVRRAQAVALEDALAEGVAPAVRRSAFPMETGTTTSRNPTEEPQP